MPEYHYDQLLLMAVPSDCCRSLLFINHEGCVNTLQEECRQFYAELGQDGRNQSFPARFPCYYAPRKFTQFLCSQGLFTAILVKNCSLIYRGNLPSISGFRLHIRLSLIQRNILLNYFISTPAREVLKYRN